MSTRMTAGTSVTLDGAGNGSAQLAPGSTGWRVMRITTNGTSTAAPTLTVRRGSATGPIVDATRFGNLDTSETSLDVHAGESLCFAYAGGTAGGVMTIYIEGESL